MEPLLRIARSIFLHDAMIRIVNDDLGEDTVLKNIFTRGGTLPGLKLQWFIARILTMLGESNKTLDSDDIVFNEEYYSYGEDSVINFAGVHDLRARIESPQLLHILFKEKYKAAGDMTEDMYVPVEITYSGSFSVEWSSE